MAVRIFTVCLDFLSVATAAGCAICLVVLLKRHLANRYPFLTGYLLFQLGHSTWLLPMWIRADYAGYSRGWHIAQPFVIVSYALLVFEGIYVQARHHRKIGIFTIVMCGGFAAIAALVCLYSVGISVPSLISEMAWFTKYYTLLCFWVLGFSRILFHFPFPRMRPNVRRHALILMGLFGGTAAWAILISAFGTNSRAVTWPCQILALSTPLACYIAWIHYLRPSGEEFTPLPYKYHSREELEPNWAMLDELREIRKIQRTVR